MSNGEPITFCGPVSMTGPVIVVGINPGVNDTVEKLLSPEQVRAQRMYELTEELNLIASIITVNIIKMGDQECISRENDPSELRKRKAAILEELKQLGREQK